METIITKRAPMIRTAPALQRVAAYARVSSGKEAMLHSLSAQVSYYNQYIQSNPTWIFSGVYADEAFTGTKGKRPEFQRMLTDCKAGKIDRIVTKSISRFARNTVDLLNAVRELKSMGISVYFEEQNIDSMSGDGELMLSILASYAQEESLSVSENCKWRIRKGFERGNPVNLYMIYGYRSVEGRIEIEPDQAVIVRRIFEEYTSGRGGCLIAKGLREDNVPTQSGGEWRDAHVREMLKNEKYTGNAILQKTFIANHLTKESKVNRGELPMYYAERTHPAIIDQETFDRAQAILSANRKATNCKKTTVTRYPFSGFIVCGHCGKHYRRKTINGKIWWQCITYLSKGKKHCPAKQIPDIALHALTCEVLGRSSFNEQVFKERIHGIHIPADNRVVFHLANGQSIEKTWRDRSRAESWTDEMREQARLHSMRRKHNV